MESMILSPHIGQQQPGHHQSGHHQLGQHQLGQHQPGNHQSGHHQPGQYQSGQYQLGQHQPGYHQPGQQQSGQYQLGQFQPGQYQLGQYQSGQYQSGYHYFGQHQPGNHQPGNHQSGQHQSGYHYFGQHQPGNHQPGNHQSGQHQSGYHYFGQYQPGNQQSGQYQLGQYQSGQHQSGQHQYQPGNHQSSQHQHPSGQNQHQHQSGHHQSGQHQHQSGQYQSGQHQHQHQSGHHQLDLRSGMPCLFFAQGNCRNGSNCPFSHAGGEAQEVVVRTPGASTAGQPCDDPPQADSRCLIPCEFFMQGTCLKAESCPYAHPYPRKGVVKFITVPETMAKAEEEERPAPSETWRRELRGALVSFGDGAVVTKVNFPSDFSAVRISNLPRDATPGYVASSLASLGLAVPVDCIRVLMLPGEPYCVADVRVEDPHFARRLCGLSILKWPGALRASPINTPMPRTKNYRRVDAKKICCSWQTPTRSASLDFNSDKLAKKAADRFTAGSYRVMGQKVRCEVPRRDPACPKQSPWAIRLVDIPDAATKGNMRRDIPRAVAPRKISISDANYPADLPTANTAVRSLLLRAGPLEWWKGAVGTNKTRYRARARFLSDEDARQAAQSYNDKPLGFADGSKLTLQIVHSARLRVSARVYDAVAQEIAGHKRAWRSQDLVYVAYPPVEDYRILKIEGVVSTDVASAKNTLEGIIAGKVVMDGGEAVWAASFATPNGEAFQKIKQLERELGVVVVCDTRRSQVRLLSPRLRHEEAHRALVELAEENNNSVFAIELDPPALSWAFKGGYHAIAAAVGHDKVTLDIVSNPRRILVTGSEADHKTAQEILQGTAKGKGRAGGPARHCAICWSEASDGPVYTPCGHAYCGDCFVALCRAGVGSGRGICCEGDDGACGAPVPLAKLQAHLSTAVLEDLLEGAFTTHVSRHPETLRPCPTPDCDQVYRAASGRGGGGPPGEAAPLFTCHACMAAVCTACHVPHDGMTCAEQRDRASGGHEAMRATRKELGIKDCPGCGIMIEKRSGCNHMECFACGVHMCWECMEAFSKSDHVYEHMERKHGGCGMGGPRIVI